MKTIIPFFFFKMPSRPNNREEYLMTPAIMLAFLLLILPAAVHADVNKVLELLPCGIYDEAAKPLIEKDLDTQHPDRGRYTMAIVTKNSKRLSVEVKSVEIRMPGERHQVSAFVDGKPFAKTSHQDVPLYLEVHVDNEKYRIICVRNDEGLGALKSESTGTAREGKKTHRTYRPGPENSIQLSPPEGR